MNQETLLKIRDLENRYCKNCALKQLNRETKSKSYAHHFCIEECSIGLSIKTHGNNL